LVVSLCSCCSCSCSCLCLCCGVVCWGGRYRGERGCCDLRCVQVRKVFLPGFWILVSLPYRCDDCLRLRLTTLLITSTSPRKSCAIETGRYSFFLSPRRSAIGRETETVKSKELSIFHHRCIAHHTDTAYHATHSIPHHTTHHTTMDDTAELQLPESRVLIVITGALRLLGLPFTSI
jgi:hypothetical protein